MKKTATILTTALTTALTLCALMGTAALAKNKFHMISFAQTTVVNGTSVKAGEYEAKFDEQSGVLTILNDNNRVIATAQAHEEALGKKAAETTYIIKGNGDGSMLEQVTFGGDRYAIVLGASGNQTGGGQ